MIKITLYNYIKLPNLQADELKEFIQFQNKNKLNDVIVSYTTIDLDHHLKCALTHCRLSDVVG